MADDPRLGAFLDQWARDQRDGVTIRSVHNRLTGHIARYDTDRQETRDRLTKLETKSEAAERQHAREELADAIAEGTGRHQAITTPVQAIPSPFAAPPFSPAQPFAIPPQPSQPEIKEPKSGFWASAGKSAAKAALKHGGTAVGAAAITLLVSWLAGRGCVAAQAVEPAPPAAASGKP